MWVWSNLWEDEQPTDEAMKYLLKMDFETLTYQSLPFFSECRVYGRLKETKKEDLAVKCYGYLILDESYSESMRKAGIEDVNLIHPDLRWELPKDEALPSDLSPFPVRALVKELGNCDDTFGPKHVPRMMRDLRKLHRLGIVHFDLKRDAYIDGRLVDFSCARTVPHFLLDKENLLLSIAKVRGKTLKDYFDFDQQLECYDLSDKIIINDRISIAQPRYNLRSRPSKMDMYHRSIKLFADGYKWKPSREDVIAFKLPEGSPRKRLHRKGSEDSDEEEAAVTQNDEEEEDGEEYYKTGPGCWTPLTCEYCKN
ncbi:hypothetical protein KJ359_007072 [Pestalotiopsis sp. 9143b]|nr:hypothetical protein KJ359_007072 [Pestalotiopsis sp. 9143b]